MLKHTVLKVSGHNMSGDQTGGAESTRAEQLNEISIALKQLRHDILDGFAYTNTQGNANTSRVLEAATFLYALIEILAEKGVLTIEELDARKDKIADRVQKRFLSEGMGVVLQEPDRDKYTFQSEAYVDCENRVHLCKAACCRMIFPLSRQDIAEGIIMWDLKAPYLIAQTEDHHCRHLDRTSCKCTVREHRPIPCRAYDCSNDPRIWSDFGNYVISPDLDSLFSNRERLCAKPVDE
jgi:Fe-S-cluster containining protein